MFPAKKNNCYYSDFGAGIYQKVSMKKFLTTLDALLNTADLFLTFPNCCAEHIFHKTASYDNMAWRMVHFSQNRFKSSDVVCYKLLIFCITLSTALHCSKFCTLHGKLPEKVTDFVLSLLVACHSWPLMFFEHIKIDIS